MIHKGPWDLALGRWDDVISPDLPRSLSLLTLNSWALMGPMELLDLGRVRMLRRRRIQLPGFLLDIGKMEGKTKTGWWFLVGQWILKLVMTINKHDLGGGFKYFLYIFSSLLWGSFPLWTNIFQMGWNHQPENVDDNDWIESQSGSKQNILKHLVMMLLFHGPYGFPAYLSLVSPVDDSIKCLNRMNHGLGRWACEPDMVMEFCGFRQSRVDDRDV